MTAPNFGLQNAKPGVICCGSPEPCTSKSPTCAWRNHSRKTAKFTWTPCVTCGFGPSYVAHQVAAESGWSHEGQGPHPYAEKPTESP